MKPSIGSIVHYVDDLGRHQAAIVVGVTATSEPDAAEVDLQVFKSGGNRIESNGTAYKALVRQDESSEPERRTWHWPELERESLDQGGAA